jgi:FAD/FMN-containing dehydrogenase
VITAATLRLFARPREITVAFAAIADVAAALALLDLMQEKSGGLVNAFELVPRFAVELVEKHIAGARDPLAKASPWYVLIEIAGGSSGMAALMEGALAAAMENNLVTDAMIAQNEGQARALWRLRETISEAQKREGASIKHDISLPLAALPAFVAEATDAVLARYPGTRPCSFGHLGDGNLHFNFNAPPGKDKEFLAEWDEIQLIVHDLVKKYGGSISAEHGIGTMKRDLLLRYKTTEELDAMRALKHAFDPKNILNPGKTVPPVYRL